MLRSFQRPVSHSTYRLHNIALVPIGKVEEASLEVLEEKLPKIFRGAACRRAKLSINVEQFSRRGSNQYHSTKMLSALERHQPIVGADRLLAITDLDLYIPTMNFVFGEAQLPGKVAIISTRRLKDTTDCGGEDLFSERIVKEAVFHSLSGMDYFIFPRGLWGDILPLAIGRTVWDNWLVYRARERGAALVDATHVITAIHQNHDYAHVPGGVVGAWTGVEAQQNQKLAGGHVFTLLDANWVLTPRGVRPALTREHLGRVPFAWLALHPDLTTVSSHHLFHYCQPQPHTAVTARA